MDRRGMRLMVLGDTNPGFGCVDAALARLVDASGLTTVERFDPSGQREKEPEDGEEPYVVLLLAPGPDWSADRMALARYRELWPGGSIIRLEPDSGSPILISDSGRIRADITVRASGPEFSPLVLADHLRAGPIWRELSTLGIDLRVGLGPALIQMAIGGERKVGVQRLASELGCSRRSLERAFHANAFQPPGLTMRWLRLAHLVVLRDTTRRTLDRLRLDLGFSSTSNMCRLCRALTGDSPRTLVSSHFWGLLRQQFRSSGKARTECGNGR